MSKSLDGDSEAFRLLGHPRRQHVVARLAEHDGTIALADLADEVAVEEYDGPITEIPAETVTDVYLSLYHKHVPKLADYGAVEYVQATDTVHVDDGIHDLADYL